MSPSHCTVIPPWQPLMSCHVARLRHALHPTKATPLCHTPAHRIFPAPGFPFGMLGQRLSFGSEPGTKLIVSTVRLECRLTHCPRKQPPSKPSHYAPFVTPLGASSVCASFVMAICINKSLALPVGTGFGWTG